MYFASETYSFKDIFCLPQMLMSVQKMLICVKMDNVWMSLVPIAVSVRWDSLPPRTAGHAKVSHCYFRFIFWVWIGCYETNNKCWKDLNPETEYSALASQVISSSDDFFAVWLMLKVAFIILWSFPGLAPKTSEERFGSVILGFKNYCYFSSFCH